MKSNKYKVYAIKRYTTVYLMDYIGMKRWSRMINGKVNWSWINEFKVDVICHNQKPYYLNNKNQICRKRYGKEIVYNYDIKAMY